MDRNREQLDEGESKYSAHGSNLSIEGSSDGSFGESPLGAPAPTLRQAIEQRPGRQGAEPPSRSGSHGRRGYADSFSIAAPNPPVAGIPPPTTAIDSFAQQNQYLLEERRLQQQDRPHAWDSMLGGQLSDSRGYGQSSMSTQQPQLRQSLSAYPSPTGQFGLSRYLEPQMRDRQQGETSRLNSLLDRQFALQSAPGAEGILSRSTSNYTPYQLQHHHHQQQQLSGIAGSFAADGPGRGFAGDTLRSTRVGPLLDGYLPANDGLPSSQPFSRTFTDASSLQNQFNFDASLANMAQPRHRIQRQRELVEAFRNEQASRNARSVGTSAPSLPYQERQQQEAKLQALLSERRELERQLAAAGNPADFRRTNVPHVGGQPDMLDSKLMPILPPRVGREADDRNTSARGKRANRGQGPKSKRRKPTPTQADSTADDPVRYTLPPGEGLPLSLPSDRGILSEYQQLIRQSIEFFEAQPNDISTGVQGRRKKIEPGQVGLRCRYCAHRPPHWRGRGAAYYPGTLACVYQAAQNMAANHFVKTCDDIPPDVHKQFVEARQKQEQETRRSGGKTYWMETSRHVGLEEREGKSGMWFRSTGT